MAELAALGTAIAGAVGEVGVGTALSAGASLASGVAANAAGNAQARAAKQAADFQSEQLVAAGAEAKAKAGRKAEEIRDRTMRVAGRNEAVAAASGAGTGGSNAQTLEDIYAEGEYQSQMAVASGENVKRGLMDKDAAQQYDAKMAANMAKAKGRAALISGVVGAGGKVIGNSYKLGGLYGSDDDTEDFDPDSGWRTTMRRGRR